MTDWRSNWNTKTSILSEVLDCVEGYAYTDTMESADAFVAMVEDSFDKIEEVVHDYGMKRIRQMEKQLDSLEQDLTEFLESAVKKQEIIQREGQ